jgi:hypothetical protein
MDAKGLLAVLTYTSEDKVSDPSLHAMTAARWWQVCFVQYAASKGQFDVCCELMFSRARNLPLGI